MIVNLSTFKSFLESGSKEELWILVSQPAFQTLMMMRHAELREELLHLDYDNDQKLSFIYREKSKELREVEDVMNFVREFKSRIETQQE